MLERAFATTRGGRFSAKRPSTGIGIGQLDAFTSRTPNAFLPVIAAPRPFALLPLVPTMSRQILAAPTHHRLVLSLPVSPGLRLICLKSPDFAMKPDAGRVSRLGLAALVAGVVAISFLATHASAQAMCTSNADCGSDALCLGECICTNEDLMFNRQTKKCEDMCASKDCGEGACIMGDDGNLLCTCGAGLSFVEDSKTCVPNCDRDCGASATCDWHADTLGCECVDQKLTYYDPDKTCFAPLLQTKVQLVWPTKGVREELTFSTSIPAEQAGRTTVCSTVSNVIGWNTKVTVTATWNASLAAAGNGMCKSLTLYGGADCMEMPGATITRPAKKGRSYPLTKRSFFESPQSIACEITTCHKDCGTAECIVKDGQQQCQCSEGLLFNAAKKLCLA
ncbi:unnamed protein product, partial [Closterium sp. Yama58-4]